MNAGEFDREHKLVGLIYHNYHVNMFGPITNPRIYFARRDSWLKAQGCHFNRKQMWDSDAQRVEFMLRWR